MNAPLTNVSLTDLWEKMGRVPRERTVQILAQMAHKLYVYQVEQISKDKTKKIADESVMIDHTEEL